jgi:hypothetical protein
MGTTDLQREGDMDTHNKTRYSLGEGLNATSQSTSLAIAAPAPEPAPEAAAAVARALEERQTPCSVCTDGHRICCNIHSVCITYDC